MTKKDLSLICNYSEGERVGTSCALFNYLSFEYPEDIKLIQKKINRNNILNKILDEENNEYDLYEPHIEYSTDNIPSINIKIYSIKVNSFIYNKIEDIYIHTLNQLESITSSNIIKVPVYKILNRLSFLQNLINMKSRINMANRIICGLNAYNELIKTGEGSFNEDGIYNIYRMDVIYSDLISTNKFIVARFGNNIESGLNLILSESTNSFYIFKTHCWENNISWFEI